LFTYWAALAFLRRRSVNFDLLWVSAVLGAAVIVPGNAWLSG
jgi:hypothetical protein